MEALIAILSSVHPVAALVLGLIGALVVLAQAVVILTPSKADDAKWEKILAIPVVGQLISGLAALAPIKKKE